MQSTKSNILSIHSASNFILKNENKQKDSSERNKVKNENNEIMLTIKEINEDKIDKVNDAVKSNKVKKINENTFYDEEEEALLKYKKNTLEDKFEDLNYKFKEKGNIKIYDIIKEKYESKK